MHKLTVGELYNPRRTRWPEGVQYNFRGGHHQLHAFFGSPSPAEIAAYRSGPAQFALRVETDGTLSTIFLLFKFGDLAWSDVSYTIHLVPEAERLLPDVVEGEQSRALLEVLLIDADTGILKAIRALSLSHAFSVQLHAAIRSQAQEPFDRARYDRLIDSSYARLSTAELVKRAQVRCRGGE